MARTKEIKPTPEIEVETAEVVENKIEENKVEKKVTISEPAQTPVKEASVNNGPSYEELMAVVQQLMMKVNTLESQQGNVPAYNTSDEKTDKILDLLANRKSDREVTIVHNCAMLGSLTTHIELTGLSIDFRRIGEQRVLSWQQFEECVSKYHSFFDKQIILLADEHKDLSEKYGVPCVHRDSQHTLTHSDIQKLGKLSVHDLEKLVESLTDSDKKVVFSYWLGKCYEKEEGFYDRYKIDTLNRLSGNHAFDNLIVFMNNDEVRH